MTLKTCSPKLLWNTLVKRCWFGAASVLLLFIAMPLSAMLSLTSVEEIRQHSQHTGYINQTPGLDNLTPAIAEEQEHLVEFVSGANAAVIFLVIGLALMAAWSGLAWLHSRKQMDLYGALPIKREKLYTMEVVAAIVWFAFAYIVNFVLTLLVGVQKEIFTGKALKYGLFGILVVLMAFLVVYFCAALAMLLTGKVLTGILGTFVFLGLIPLTILFLEELPRMFFVSYVSTYSIFDNLAVYLSPLLLIANVMGEIGWYLEGESQMYVSWLPVVLLLVWIVGQAALSVLLLKIRPAEGAEQSMVFPKTEGIIKVAILYPLAIGGGIFFWMLGGQKVTLEWFWFGLLFTGAVISCVIELIYHWDKKCIFNHKIGTGISLGAAIVSVLVFRFDIFGVDCWIPEEDEVSNMVLLDNHSSNWFEYPDGISYGGQDYLRNHIDETTGACINAYLPEALELIEKYKDAHYGDEEAKKYFQDNEWERIAVVYKMKDGSIKERTYRLTEASLEELRRQLFDEWIYREAWLPLVATGDDVYQMRLNKSYDGKDNRVDVWSFDFLEYEFSLEKNREFVNLYRKDLSTLSYDRLFGWASEWEYMEFEGFDNRYLQGNYPINKHFMESWEYLRAYDNLTNQEDPYAGLSLKEKWELQEQEKQELEKREIAGAIK